ncbi:11243_t:CDS:2, partial [Gigaspora rosea]
MFTNDGRIIIFGGNSANDDLRRIVTSDQLQTNSSFNNNIYLFDVQNYTWISSITPTSIILTSTTEKTSSNNSSNIMAIEIGIGVSGFIIILCMIIAGFSYYKYRKLRKAIVGMPGTNSYPIETP